MAPLPDRKFSMIRFVHPVWVDGLGMVDKLDTTPDPETRKPRLEGVSMTWLVEEGLLKVVTRSGETLINPAGWSGKPIYPDLTKSKK
jgi:hypothetical protein